MEHSESSELFEALFRASSDAIVVSDDAGRICLVNDACVRLFGHDRPTLVGAPVELLVPARFGRHRAHRAGFEQDPRPRGMGSGRTLVGLHADGRELPVDVALSPLLHAGRRYVAATIRDLRDRAFGGETLRVQATALRSAANGIVITDRGGTITWVNPAACAITGYAAEELVGRHTRALKSGQHEPAFYASIWETVLAGRTWSGTIVNRRRDGALYHEEQTIAPVVDEQGEISHFIAIKQDVTERRLAEEALAQVREDLAARVAQIESLNEQLREQAIRDPLTGLHNRRCFHESIERDAAAAARRGEPIALLAIDVDHFKGVNDRFGHAIGDAALVALGELLRGFVRASDLACRFGGEEFVIALPGAGIVIAQRRAEELRAAFAALEIPGAPALRATISIGVCAVRVGAESIEAALARADGALYEAKRGGRDRVVVAID